MALVARGFLAVLMVLILIVLLIWSLQRRLIYFPDRSTPALASGASAVTLRTDDGLRLSAWLIPPMGTEDRRLSVLVAHGNAGDREGRMPLGRALASLGLTVLLLDYRGYGGNPGGPSERGLALDADAARDHLDTLGQPVVYFGESLGAAVVTALAVRRPPAALVLRSPFRSLAAAGKVHYPLLPVGPLLRDRYPVETQIAQVRVPTLIVWGTADTVVPGEQSAAVAAAAGGPVRTLAIAGAGHNDRAMLDGPELIAAVRALLDDLP
ncbi:alpha/beta fold hydrolase [Actinoplanes sp. NPDC023714]|uniref:alpha/beta hydrolase n=1 Tax=Actinoplanes sp. NPDC023714 TaxID=3154322 RepID=UPI0034071D2B